MAVNEERRDDVVKSSVSDFENEVCTQDNESLLVLIGNFRDRRAFEEIFTRFSKRIFGLGMKLSANEQISKDLVQDVMLTVWQNAASYDLDRGAAQSWIFAMARNKCIDLLRKANRAQVPLLANDVWSEELLDNESVRQQLLSETTENAVLAYSDIKRLENLCQKLPLPQREAIALIYVEDNTHEEAAIKLSIPLGTLKSRVRLGMIKLKEMVEN